jgi:hypothetical protein
MAWLHDIAKVGSELPWHSTTVCRPKIVDLEPFREAFSQRSIWQLSVLHPDHFKQKKIFVLELTKVQTVYTAH